MSDEIRGVVEGSWLPFASDLTWRNGPRASDP